MMELSGYVPESVYKFMKRLEGMSYIERQIFHQNGRRENDAEHTFQALVTALLLWPYSEDEVDLLRVFKMILVHDIPELIAGDTSVYANQDGVKDREKEAAVKLFGMLPVDQGGELLELWEEFEAQETAESRFANAVDYLQPGIMNVVTGGMSWKIFNITREKAVTRKADLVKDQPLFRDFLRLIVEESDERNLWSPSIG